MAYSDSLSLTSRFAKDSATIQAAGKTIVVAPTQLKVDGRVVAAISPDVSNVEVHVKRGAIEFITDGKRWPAIR